MTNKCFQKLLRKSHRLIPLVKQNRTWHFTFILKKQKILTVGYNRFRKTDSFQIRNGYPYGNIHSEIAAIKAFGRPIRELAGLTIVNIRLSKTYSKTQSTGILLAKPCKYCSRLLSDLEVGTVYYSVPEGLKKLEKESPRGV